MEETRLTLLPDERLAALATSLDARLTAIGQSITPRNFASLLDEGMQRVIRLAFSDVGASEGSIWLVDESVEALVIAYNTGSNAGKLVGQFRQPLRAGLISMVFSRESPFVENEVFKNSKRDKTLDSLLGLRTFSMIATPFYFLKACRGVVSCVQLSSPVATEPDPSFFTDVHAGIVGHATRTLGRLIDYSILQATLGLA